MEEKQNNSNKKKMIIILVTIFTVLVIAIGVGSYLFLTKEKEVSKQNNWLQNEKQQQEDTEPPVLIGITDKEIKIGEEINLLEGIEAKDNTEGEIKITSEGSIDNTQEGEYSIKVIAEDKNGNMTEQTFKVIVKKEITEVEQKEGKQEETKEQNTLAKTEQTTQSTQTTKPTTQTVETTQASQAGTTNDNLDTSNNTNQSSNNKTEQPSKPTLTGTETQKELANTETKYGVKINTYTTTIYNVYSDGSKTINSTNTAIEYDRSNYSATTSELLSEAKTARSKYAQMISQVAKNVNSYRKEANTNLVNKISNRSDLVLDEKLCQAACVRAVEMAYSLKFSHTRPNGTNCYTVLNEMGINYMAVGENIASGQSTANAVSNSWKNSQGHYNNMISDKFSKIGVGVYKLDGAYYWVQFFSK